MLWGLPELEAACLPLLRPGTGFSYINQREKIGGKSLLGMCAQVVGGGQEAAAFGEKHSFRTAKGFIHRSWTVPSSLPHCREQVRLG